MFARAMAAAGVIAAWGIVAEAQADVLVRIDKSMQRMTVSVDGETRHVWPVSTGRAGYGTPNGSYRAQWTARHWFSRKYYNSPMPHSIFFHKGYAIHGTNYIRRLGGPASHGCVRLHPGNAATLFALVGRHGKKNTRIVVTGANPVAIAKSRRKPAQRARARARGYEANAYSAPRAYAPRYRAYPAYAPYYDGYRRYYYY